VTVRFFINIKVNNEGVWLKFSTGGEKECKAGRGKLNDLISQIFAD
jgi:hypothetical protein